MNADQRKKIQLFAKQLDAHRDSITEINNALETLRDEEQDKLDNLSEGLQQADIGEKMETAIAALSECCEALDDVYTELESAVSHLEAIE